MRLTGPEIKKQIELGLIDITPFDESQLGPNSYDVRLAPTLYEVEQPYTGRSVMSLGGFQMSKTELAALDIKLPCSYVHIEIPETGYELKPGKFYLGVTKEFTATNDFLPILDGRSSCARYGMTVHQTAGFGDVGFAGHWTLEITVALPLIIYPNIRIAQVSFEQVMGTIKNYKDKGNYINEYTENPKPRIGKPGNFF